MRYVRELNGYDAEAIELAESLFERFVGKRLSATLYKDHVRLVNSRGSLKRGPIIEIVSIKAICEKSAHMPWPLTADILVSSVAEHDGILVLPPAFTGEAFTSANIAYIVGLDKIPADIESMVYEIAGLVKGGQMTEWSGFDALSDDARTTIARYKAVK